MDIISETGIVKYPQDISSMEALYFYLFDRTKQDVLMVLAANWRSLEVPWEEGWFEELTSDEFDDEDFVELFADATLVLTFR